MSDLDDLPGQLIELRDLIRHAHEAVSDLRAVLREARAVRDSLPEAADKAAGDRINAAVAAGLDSYQEALDKAIESGTQAVFKRFDRIEKLLLGEDPKSVRAGKPSIPQMLDTLAKSGRLFNSGPAGASNTKPGLEHHSDYCNPERVLETSVQVPPAAYRKASGRAGGVPGGHPPAV